MIRLFTPTGLTCLLAAQACIAGELRTLKLPPAENMTRAELHYVKMAPHPKAILVLCPGANGNGKGLIRSDVWQDFARKENLGLVGLSFASSLDAIKDGTGYYYAAKGSGEVLLSGLRKIYGRDLPMILCGISGGAHFTSRFTEWNPERVLAWCAYAAGWWDVPAGATVTPPGIVACGDADHRYGAAMIYFKQGRAAGKPWAWISLGGVGHAGSQRLDDFVRNYFSTILAGQAQDGIWVDVDLKTRITQMEAERHPALSAWLPTEKLFQEWKEVHTP